MAHLSPHHIHVTGSCSFPWAGPKSHLSPQHPCWEGLVPTGCTSCRRPFERRASHMGAFWWGQIRILKNGNLRFCSLEEGEERCLRSVKETRCWFKDVGIDLDYLSFSLNKFVNWYEVLLVKKATSSDAFLENKSLLTPAGGQIWTTFYAFWGGGLFCSFCCHFGIGVCFSAGHGAQYLVHTKQALCYWAIPQVPTGVLLLLLLFFFFNKQFLFKFQCHIIIEFLFS
jgi:hypothetical protein